MPRRRGRFGPIHRSFVGIVRRRIEAFQGQLLLGPEGRTDIISSFVSSTRCLLALNEHEGEGPACRLHKTNLVVKESTENETDNDEDALDHGVPVARRHAVVENAHLHWADRRAQAL